MSARVFELIELKCDEERLAVGPVCGGLFMEDGALNMPSWVEKRRKCSVGYKDDIDLFMGAYDELLSFLSRWTFSWGRRTGWLTFS